MMRTLADTAERCVQPQTRATDAQSKRGAYPLGLHLDRLRPLTPLRQDWHRFIRRQRLVAARPVGPEATHIWANPQLLRLMLRRVRTTHGQRPLASCAAGALVR